MRLKRYRVWQPKMDGKKVYMKVNYKDSRKKQKRQIKLSTIPKKSNLNSTILIWVQAKEDLTTNHLCPHKNRMILVCRTFLEVQRVTLNH